MAFSNREVWIQVEYALIHLRQAIRNSPYAVAFPDHTIYVEQLPDMVDPVIRVSSTAVIRVVRDSTIPNAWNTAIYGWKKYNPFTILVDSRVFSSNNGPFLLVPLSKVGEAFLEFIQTYKV